MREVRAERTRSFGAFKKCFAMRGVVSFWDLRYGCLGRM